MVETLSEGWSHIESEHTSISRSGQHPCYQSPQTRNPQRRPTLGLRFQAPCLLWRPNNGSKSRRCASLVSGPPRLAKNHSSLCISHLANQFESPSCIGSSSPLAYYRWLFSTEKLGSLPALSKKTCSEVIGRWIGSIEEACGRTPTNWLASHRDVGEKAFSSLFRGICTKTSQLLVYREHGLHLGSDLSTSRSLMHIVH